MNRTGRGIGRGEVASRLRSSQVAAAAGVNAQTLRYYERRGLLAEPERSLGGHRLYPAEAVITLRVIKAAQRLGFTLDEVAELLDTGRHRHGRPDAGLRAAAQAKLAEVQAKIADLHVIADTLRATLDAGCDDLVECAGAPRCPIPFAPMATPMATGHDAGTRLPRGHRLANQLNVSCRSQGLRDCQGVGAPRRSERARAARSAPRHAPTPHESHGTLEPHPNCR